MSKDDRQITEILEAYDLARSFNAAGVLAQCDPKTVSTWRPPGSGENRFSAASPASIRLLHRTHDDPQARSRNRVIEYDKIPESYFRAAKAS